MTATGIARKLDELGRVVIPKEMRDELKWDENTRVNMVQFGKYVLLRSNKKQGRKQVPEVEKNPIYQDILQELCVLTDGDLLQILELVRRLAEPVASQDNSSKRS